jgi:hypothetical protein
MDEPMFFKTIALTSDSKRSTPLQEMLIKGAVEISKSSTLNNQYKLENVCNSLKIKIKSGHVGLLSSKSSNTLTTKVLARSQNLSEKAYRKLHGIPKTPEERFKGKAKQFLKPNWDNGYVGRLNLKVVVKDKFMDFTSIILDYKNPKFTNTSKLPQNYQIPEHKKVDRWFFNYALNIYNDNPDNFFELSKKGVYELSLANLRLVVPADVPVDEDTTFTQLFS